MAKALGEAIQRRREAKRWQVKELAAKIGKSGPSVSNYESGKTNPSRPVYRLLLDVLEVPVKDRPQWDEWWEEGDGGPGGASVAILAAKLAELEARLERAGIPYYRPYQTAA